MEEKILINKIEELMDKVLDGKLENYLEAEEIVRLLKEYKESEIG